MAVAGRVDEMPPVEIRGPGDSSTVRHTNRAGYNPLATANGATPGKPNGDRLAVDPGSNARQPGNQRWPRG